MTVIDQLIKESSGIEQQIKNAVELAKISKRASQILCDEMIRMIVQLQMRDLILRQAYNQSAAQGDAISVPDNRIVMPRQ